MVYLSGAVAAGAGMAAGAVVGRKIKEIHREDNEVELQNLTDASKPLEPETTSGEDNSKTTQHWEDNF